MSEQLLRKINSFSFPSEKASLIYAFKGGSDLHGAKLEGKNDSDIYGIFIEKPEYVCGLNRFEHFVSSTSSDAERNTSADVDVTCYGLCKWATLAVKGNPTALEFLFAPTSSYYLAWNSVLWNRNKFIAKSHGHQFMGYADAQLRRMAGERGTGKHGQRDELVIKHGYDTKAAMHCLRVLFEGIELMESQYISMPRPDHEKDLLLSVRRGEWSMERVTSKANELFSKMHAAMRNSGLPESVDQEYISKFIAYFYLDYWRPE